MKIKKANELKAKTNQELVEFVRDLRKEISSLKLDKSQFKLKDERSIFQKRKELARALTILSGRRKEENA